MRYVTPGSFERRLAAGLVETESGCIEWTKAKTPHGYGRIGRGARGQGWAFTHRAAWELARGEIPSGMFVCHRCDNPPCCNPSHLRLGTQRENLADMREKSRGVTTHFTGERNPAAKLTWAQVGSIRERHSAGESARSLAREYGINHKTALQIVNRLIWRD